MDNTNHSLSRILLICIALIVVTGMISALGFWLLPVFGVALAVTTGAWAIVIASVILLTVALLLFFIIPFFLIILISVLAFLWVLGSIIFFPITFPVVIPLLIILICIAVIRKK